MYVFDMYRWIAKNSFLQNQEKKVDQTSCVEKLRVKMKYFTSVNALICP